MKENVKTRLVLYSWLGFILTEWLDYFFINTTLFTIIKENHFMIVFVSSLNTIFLSVALSSMLIFGNIAIIQKGFSVKRIIVLIISIAGFILMTVLPFINYSSLEKMSSFLKENTPFDNAKFVESQLRKNNLSIDKRAVLSKHYAELKYEKDGIILDYITKENDKLTFRPTTKQAKERDERLISNAETILIINLAKGRIWSNLIYWCSLLVLNVIIVLILRPRKMQS